MPEVNLGINPGAGGTQRLPRLIGLPAALKMLLTAAPLDAAQALDLGLIDAVCDGHELEETARRLLRAGGKTGTGPEPRCDGANPTASSEGPVPVFLVPRRTRQQTAKITDAAANAAAFAEAEKSIAAVRPELIAPRKIVAAVRAGIEQSFAAGLVKEQQVFAECMETAATRNKIYLFFATRETGKTGDGARVSQQEAGLAAQRCARPRPVPVRLGHFPPQLVQPLVTTALC
jgi:3-hydroxyacyl-CoA dehydrogenase